MESLVSYLVAAMVAWVPLRAQMPIETSTIAQVRYERIAHDVAEVVLDDDEAPLFEGPDARAQTALLMLSIASFESSYRRTVDDGIRRGDHGISYCLMQIQVRPGATREGWTGPQLIEDRKRCFRAALHILQLSFATCHGLPPDDRMSAYAIGHCVAQAEISRSRIRRARAWWESHSPPRAAGSDS